MNQAKKILLGCFFAAPVFGFSQNKISELGNAIKQSSQPSQSSGTQSNLAVSDEGTGGTKQQSSKTATPEKGKQDPKSPGSSNLAVSDEGATGTKGKKSSSRETHPADSAKKKEKKSDKAPLAKPKE